jgi:hypothetical protein
MAEHEEMAEHAAANGTNIIYLPTWRSIMLVPRCILPAPAIKLNSDVSVR